MAPSNLDGDMPIVLEKGLDSLVCHLGEHPAVEAGFIGWQRHKVGPQATPLSSKSVLVVL